MINVVIDTNVIVSALLSPNGKPETILSLVSKGILLPYYNIGILDEYSDVLSRPALNIAHEKKKYFLDNLKSAGTLISSTASTEPMPDESDRKFYDVAKAIGACLITGNTKHYPDEAFIQTPAEFLEKFF